MRNSLWLLLAFLFVGCGSEKANRYNTGEDKEEIISLLNEREFSKAIWLIENQNKNPEGETAYLLAQAYLGRAGIEPLAFAAKVAGPELESEAAKVLFPKCPTGAIKSADQIPIKCLLKRVYLYAPNADLPDLARARLLFRKAYPDASVSPAWINTLIGTVELISLVKRAGDLFVYAKGVRSVQSLSFGPGDLEWLKAQGKNSLLEAKETLARANHSGEKISRLVTGNKANEWFTRVDGAIGFAETVGLARFLDFVRENLLKASDEIKYAETLDQLRMVLELIDK